MNIMKHVVPLTAVAPEQTAAVGQSPHTLMQVEDLHISFEMGTGGLFTRQPKQRLQAVRGISFSVKQGETFSLVGESGCGKSTVARALAGLYAPTQGKIFHAGKALNPGETSPGRGIQMIFQDPYASLNPRWRVERIIAEPLRLQNRVGNTRQARGQIAALLRQVGLAEADMFKFPHEFSGGQRQRISIARALATQPDFLICDEPTSALDVSVQAQVLNLMSDLQDSLGLTYFFISHNMSVIAHISDRVGVMYLGRIVELGPVDEIFRQPGHPYTRMLIDAIPKIEQPSQTRSGISGEMPSALSPPSGCAFHPRCPQATDICRQVAPPVQAMSELHQIECHHPAATARPSLQVITGENR
ncbi:ABC transporter ATP-binding protein [Rouxiella sp. WC2420]|uniref:ABC transporter ATP-binding protein n=1 Tax=Rouxiella sp. WC2420 TaxID=3234145 RepID=A0AB39VKT1_9GAMM